jgi:hypothetical protein
MESSVPALTILAAVSIRMPSGEAIAGVSASAQTTVSVSWKTILLFIGNLWIALDSKLLEKICNRLHWGNKNCRN